MSGTQIPHLVPEKCIQNIKNTRGKLPLMGRRLDRRVIFK